MAALMNKEDKNHYQYHLMMDFYLKLTIKEAALRAKKA